MAQKTRAPTSDFATGGTVAYSSGTTGYNLVNDYPDTADPLTTYVQLGTTANSFIAFSYAAFDVPTAGTAITNITARCTTEEPTNGANSSSLRLRVGTTYYDTSITQPSTTTQTLSAVWTTNPATGAAWTVADVNGTGANPLNAFGIIGPDSNPAWRLGSIQIEVNYTNAQTLTQSASFSDSDGLAYAHTVSPGAVALTQTTRFDAAATFYAHTVSQPVAGQDLTQASRFDNSGGLAYAHTLTATVGLAQSTRFDGAATFYAHVVSPGAVDLAQSTRFDGAAIFYAHVVSPGAVDLAQSARFDGAATFYAHTVTAEGGDQTLTQSASFSDSDGLAYAHTVSPGAVALVQSARFDNAADFYTHTVTAEGGDQTLTQAGRFDGAAIFYAPILALDELPSPSPLPPAASGAGFVAGSGHRPRRPLRRPPVSAEPTARENDDALLITGAL